MAKRKQGEAHVRLYRHELQSAAYRSLSCGARALLTEFRALYTGKENRVYMSLREARKRTGLGQRPAQRAIADLLDRGFIRLLEKGSFHCKVGHASLYQLTNEPPDNRAGSVASKDFMRWQPKKHGSRSDYRPVADTTTEALGNTPENAPNGSQNGYRKPPKPDIHGSQNSYTDKLPSSAAITHGPFDGAGGAGIEAPAVVALS